MARPDRPGRSQSGDWLQQMCCLWNVAHDVVDGFRDIPGLTITAVRGSGRVTRWRGSRPCTEWFDLDWSPASAAGHPRGHVGTEVGEGKAGFSWNLRGGLSRTAFQPMDSKAAAGCQWRPTVGPARSTRCANAPRRSPAGSRSRPTDERPEQVGQGAAEVGVWLK